MIPATNWGPEDSKYQFTKWDGSTKDQDEFWIKPNIKQWYKNHLYKMANRVNTYNGIQYKNDPTIFAWNIFNEFRCTKEFCWEADISVQWTTEMAQFIKSVDPNHLVCGLKPASLHEDPAMFSVYIWYKLILTSA